MLDVYAVVYLDDILIFSKTKEEHVQHVPNVLRKLRENKFYANAEKCTFHVLEVEYLGIIASGDGVRVDPVKVKTVQEWPTPRSVKNIQEFVGFANFYRRFVDGYSNKAAPMYRLLKKDTPWRWGPEEEKSFQSLKDALTSSPVLRQPDIDLPFFVECDASDYATGAVLSQKDTEGRLHPVAFLSKSLLPAERNYDIFDKEMLAVVRALKEWRHFLEGSSSPFTVLTDHKNLEYFSKSKVLNRRQIRWIGFLSDFNFVIQYRPGAENGKADILSRRLDHLPPLGGGENRALLNPAFFLNAITPDSEIESLIRDTQDEDGRLKEALELLREGKAVKDWTLVNGIARFKGKLFVPQDNHIRKLILEANHDAVVAGHPGRKGTLDLISRKYYWPSMTKMVNKYVDGCDSCQRTKPNNQLPHGELNPIEPPLRPWEEITYDLITGLPESEGFDAVLTVVDRFSKMAHYIPTSSHATSVDMANLFVTHMWKLHGLPKRTISDRGTVFNSKFLKQVYKRLDIKPSFSTAYHPQTDGQSERSNQILEAFLRHYVSHRQNDWAALLPLAEFAYNNRVQSSTGRSPFFTCYGYHPKMTISNEEITSVPAGDDHAEFLRLGFEEVHASLKLANESTKEFYDRHHNETPRWEIGSKVWLSHENIETDRPSRKLSHRQLGPYEILDKFGSHAYKLKLPKSMRIHDVFHVSLLRATRPDEFDRHPAPPEPVVTPEQEEEYEVERILNSRRHRGRIQYLVRWKGYGPEDDNWEPVSNVKNACAVINDFHRANPEAPRP